MTAKPCMTAYELEMKDITDTSRRVKATDGGAASGAEVPELAWCAADGATYQEAVANVEVVIDEWIETATEKGWTIPEPKGRHLIYA
jgi:predicted RNase H-like HicB family nuclease